jgi:hypothetical protein
VPPWLDEVLEEREPVPDRRVDRARRDRVDPHVARGGLARGDLGQLDHRRLGHRVGAGVRLRLSPATDAVSTAEPPSLSSRSAVRSDRNAPSRLTESTRRHSSNGVSATGARRRCRR